MTTESIELIHRLSEYAHQQGAAVLLEVHGHFSQQVEIARHADLVYDFALPPLVLHAILGRDPGPLVKWLDIRPPNAVTVLDTHDGIGIIDAGANELRPSQPGLLSDAQVATLVESIHSNSGGTSRLATGITASNLDLYQVNCTFYDALGRDDYGYLLARAIQLFVPGIPQVYYVGLLAGTNDVELLAKTGVGRDINRHRYTTNEIDEQLLRPVVRAQLRLLWFRAEKSVFNGEFSHEEAGGRIRLRWRTRSDEALLEADMLRASFTISLSSNGQSHVISDRDLLSSSQGGRCAPLFPNSG
jgi:sucrose phosphorylase